MKTFTSRKINSLLQGGVLLVVAVLFSAQAPLACDVKSTATGQKASVGQSCNGRTVTTADAGSNQKTGIVKANAIVSASCTKGEKAIKAGSTLPATCAKKAAATGQKASTEQSCGDRTVRATDADGSQKAAIVKANAIVSASCTKGEKALKAGSTLSACCAEKTTAKANLTLTGTSGNTSKTQ